MTNHFCQQSIAREIRVPELITHVDNLMEKHDGEKVFHSMGAISNVIMMGFEKVTEDTKCTSRC